VGIREHRSDSCLYFAFDNFFESSLQAVNKHWLLCLSIFQDCTKWKLLNFSSIWRKYWLILVMCIAFIENFYFIKNVSFTRVPVCSFLFPTNIARTFGRIFMKLCMYVMSAKNTRTSNTCFVSEIITQQSYVVLWRKLLKCI